MIHQMRWTQKKVAQRLALIEPLVYRRRHEMPAWRYAELAGPQEPAPVGLEIDDHNWATIAPHTYWGTWGTTFVLRTRFQVPAGWEAKRPVALYLPLGEAGDFSHPEALVYVDGEPLGACDRHHQEIKLPAAACDGAEHLIALHGWTGLGGWKRTLPATQLYMQPCEVVQIDQATRDFVATTRVAVGAVEGQDENAPARGRLLNALDAAFKVLDTREPLGDAFYASVPAAHDALRAGVEQAGPPLDVHMAAAGHAHIDVAWLWTLGQTRGKVGRTFHNVLRLMDEFPEYRFVQSQAQLYEYVRQDYPDLFRAIQERAGEGRWETIGGTWVEMDCNISGPEALARQFLLGSRFFRHYFPGEQSPVLWLPDVFGFCASLPQLVKLAGMEYFFTIKLGWNQYNRIPYNTFWWQGLDGSRILAHFSTTPWLGAWFDTDAAGTYNAQATPQEAMGAWYKLKQKSTPAELSMIYGNGDGGGGPTREMLENLREMRSFPGLPQVEQSNMADFYRRLEATAGEELPTWNGELYFELHRGTYTTQSRNKRANRKSEFLLHDAEFLASWAALLVSDFVYPHEDLRRAWELVCLNQFHDIIPGSSIGEVYRESLEQYEQVRELGSAVRDEALAALSAQVGGDLLLVNPTSFVRRDLAFWPGVLPEGQHLQRPDGEPVACQPAEGGSWLAAGELPPYGVLPLRLAAGDAPATTPAELTVTPTLLENNLLRVELNSAGDLTRIYDKRSRREVLPAGSLANQFQAFEDRPMEWDAWDIDIFYDDKMWTAEPAGTVRVVEAGPLRATLEIHRRILHSDFVQQISLAAGSAQLDFDTQIEWRERHVLLKVAFPVEVLSPAATYEIQWGAVQRPTHRNTSWDWARFEGCAQKWVDLSEGDYGVSVLNDCKYGHDVRDNVIRISLLRSPTLPDPEADQGSHRFAYSLRPHENACGESTVAAGYALNDPILVAAAGGGETCSAHSLVSVDRPNVVIETVKQAEDGDGLIVRLYESQRQRGLVRLTAGFELVRAWRANLLEENEVELTPHDNHIEWTIKPFEIVTLRLQPGPGVARAGGFNI